MASLTSPGPTRVGVIGAGGFAAFVAAIAHTVPDLELTAVFDQDAARSAAMAHDHGLATCHDLAELMRAVDAVIIATPPSSHADLSLRALAAGCHVFCEKPMALSLADAERVRAAADRHGRTFVVDHVIRYNPLVQLLESLRVDGVLGAVQRFLFENDAGDSQLDSRHWFWDPRLSGGILLEHGVHFFDAATMLIGAPAQSVNALGSGRADGRIDTVVATVAHANGALATHMHGFAHPGHAERQLMRVDYGWAEARLEGWIPLSLRLEAWTDEDGLRALRDIADDPGHALSLPGFRPLPSQAATVVVEPAPTPASSRDRTREAPHHASLAIRLGLPEEKPQVYAESVRAALTDFATCLRTGRTPSGGATQGATTVAVAQAATSALWSGRTEAVSPLL